MWIRKKPINFVDDVVVPAERIGELIRYLEEFSPDSECRLYFWDIGNGAPIIPLLDVNDQTIFRRWCRAITRFTNGSGRFGGSSVGARMAGCVPNTCGRCSARSCNDLCV
jgi:hypothetical protein